MGFLDQLRMNGIYGGSGGDMFTPLAGAGRDPYEEIVRDFLRLRGSQQQPKPQRVIEQPKQEPIPKKKVLDVTKPPETPQLRFGGVVRDPWEMNDYQRASIRLREREVGLRDENSDRTFDLNQQKFGETQNQNDRRNEQAESRITDQKKRTEIADFRRMNPGLKEVNTKGGNVILYNPITGATIDTGIASGEHTADQAADVQRDLANVRQAGQEKLVGIRGEEARKTDAAKDTSKPLLPTQQRVEHYNRAKQIFDSNPKLAPYIKLGEGNDFTIEAPGKTFFGGTSGPSDSDYKALTDAIYGVQTPASTAPAPKVETPPSAAPVVKPPVTTGGHTIGDIKTFPNGNRARWDGNGWEQIKK